MIELYPIVKTVEMEQWRIDAIKHYDALRGDCIPMDYSTPILKQVPSWKSNAELKRSKLSGVITSAKHSMGIDQTQTIMSALDDYIKSRLALRTSTPSPENDAATNINGMMIEAVAALVKLGMDKHQIESLINKHSTAFGKRFDPFLYAMVEARFARDSHPTEAASLLRHASDMYLTRDITYGKFYGFYYASLELVEQLIGMKCIF